MENKRLEELIELAPSLALVAHLCGVTVAAVEGWRKKGEVPPFAAIVLADRWGNLPHDLKLICPKQQDWPGAVGGQGAVRGRQMIGSPNVNFSGETCGDDATDYLLVGDDFSGQGFRINWNGDKPAAHSFLDDLIYEALWAKGWLNERS